MAEAPQAALAERIQLQDTIIELLNRQLRECRESLDQQARSAADAHRRLQLAQQLQTVALDDLRRESESLQRERDRAAVAQQSADRLAEELSGQRRENERMRRSWSWRLTKPLRVLPALGPRR